MSEQLVRCENSPDESLVPLYHQVVPRSVGLAQYADLPPSPLVGPHQLILGAYTLAAISTPKKIQPSR